MRINAEELSEFGNRQRAAGVADGRSQVAAEYAAKPLQVQMQRPEAHLSTQLAIFRNAVEASRLSPKVKTTLLLMLDDLRDGKIRHGAARDLYPSLFGRVR